MDSKNFLKIFNMSCLSWKINQNRIEIKKNMDLKENFAYKNIQIENVCEKNWLKYDWWGVALP